MGAANAWLICVNIDQHLQRHSNDSLFHSSNDGHERRVRQIGTMKVSTCSLVSLGREGVIYHDDHHLSLGPRALIIRMVGLEDGRSTLTKHKAKDDKSTSSGTMWHE